MSEISPLEVADGMVVTLAFQLTVDGEVIEDTQDGEPIQFIQGKGQVLPALEAQLYGMHVGDRKHITLKPTEGYGEYDPDAFIDIPRAEFPAKIPLKPGTELGIRDEDGKEHYGRIEAVDPNHVRVNLNPILAGKEMNFAVRIVALRHARPKELRDGQVSFKTESED